jgi:hypothetical protein
VPDIVRDLITRKLDELARRFQIFGWEGPFYSPPEATVAYYARFGKEVEFVWEVWFQLTYSPDSENPDRIGEPTRASVALSDTDLLKMDIPAIAKKVTMAAAGRAVHETFEWAKLDGERILNPHARPEELHETASKVYEYLMKGASKE